MLEEQNKKTPHHITGYSTINHQGLTRTGSSRFNTPEKSLDWLEGRYFSHVKDQRSLIILRQRQVTLIRNLLETSGPTIWGCHCNTKISCWLCSNNRSNKNKMCLNTTPVQISLCRHCIFHRSMERCESCIFKVWNSSLCAGNTMMELAVSQYPSHNYDC